MRHPMVGGGAPRWAVAWGEDRYGAFASFAVDEVEHRMRWVPAGTFVMGSPESERGRWDDEGPQHAVKLTRGYWLGETPVTQALWTAVMGRNPSKFIGANRPVECVSWEDCQAFCATLNGQVPGLFARLATEAEWERACRGGTTGATWVGELVYEDDDLQRSSTLDAIAWYGGNSGGASHPVGGKEPNPYGLYDILGNVDEWCQDFSGEYQADSVIDPVELGFRVERIARGGAWDCGARGVRAARRYKRPPSTCEPYLGFRLSGGQDSSFHERAGQGLRSGVAASTRNAAMPRVTLNTREPWAVAEGRDDSGCWAVIELGGVRHRLRLIPSGTFTMGSPSTERGRWDDEGPQHEVTLTRGYWLGETPVTQGFWEAVMGGNPSHFRGIERPVEQVSWEDCQEFLVALRERVPGLNSRLPTEAEWERACRGGTTGATWVGELEFEDERKTRSPTLEAIAWYGNNSGGESHPVGAKAANPYGLHDMLGNVLEWCQDWLGNYQPVSSTNPIGLVEGALRVIRGGAWSYDARYVRASYRNASQPFLRDAHLGFRVARDHGSMPKEGDSREWVRRA